MSGVFVAVVGPSGAGKDSLMAGAKAALGDDPRFTFVRRVVTRPSDGTEDHDSLDPSVFHAAVKAGAFALNWGAHGLYYGIPDGVREAVAGGKVAIANLSRGAIPKARLIFPSCSVVLVTARPEILAARLGQRQRASDGDINARLARDAATVEGDDVITLDNSGALADGIAALTAHLRQLADQ